MQSSSVSAPLATALSRAGPFLCVHSAAQADGYSVYWRFVLPSLGPVRPRSRCTVPAISHDLHAASSERFDDSARRMPFMTSHRAFLCERRFPVTCMPHQQDGLAMFCTPHAAREESSVFPA